MPVHLFFSPNRQLVLAAYSTELAPPSITNLLINNINLVASYTDLHVTFQSLRNILSVISCGEIHGGSVSSVENYTMSVVKTSTVTLLL